jgi:hypothetical protein
VHVEGVFGVGIEGVLGVGIEGVHINYDRLSDFTAKERSAYMVHKD